MLRSVAWALCIALFTVPLAHAQGPQSDVQYGSQMSKEIDLESQAERGVPGLLDDLERAQNSLKRNDFQESQSAVEQARKEIAAMQKVLSDNPEYREVAMSLKKIDFTLEEAGFALQVRQKAKAGAELTQATRFTKSLAASPVLKLTATKVSLMLANREIQGGNYGSAAAWLDRAIDNITALLQSPNANQAELTALKNDIVIAHQQVIIGKMKDRSYLNKLYDRASAATTNAMYQYYDMWTMNPNTPWSWY